MAAVNPTIHMKFIRCHLHGGEFHGKRYDLPLYVDQFDAPVEIDHNLAVVIDDLGGSKWVAIYRRSYIAFRDTKVETNAHYDFVCEQADGHEVADGQGTMIYWKGDLQ